MAEAGEFAPASLFPPGSAPLPVPASPTGSCA